MPEEGIPRHPGIDALEGIQQVVHAGLIGPARLVPGGREVKLEVPERVHVGAGTHPQTAAFRDQRQTWRRATLGGGCNAEALGIVV